jgi:putative NIF3 family GTP cyclohydrolase 1 type 2
MTSSIGTLALARTLAAVETVAPLALAETAWDNVGVLLQAPHTHTHTTTPHHQYTHHPRHMASRVFLVNDLTRETLDEALGDDKVAVIVAYHPPLFKSFKRLTMQDAKQAIALRCAAAGVSIISPHTALDACIGGVNDWLVQGVCGAGTRERSVDLVEWTRKMMQEGRLRAINVNKEAGERFAMHGAGSRRIIDLDNGGDDLDVIVKRVKAFLGLSHGK